MCGELCSARAHAWVYMRCLAFLKMVRPFLYARAATVLLNLLGYIATYKSLASTYRAFLKSTAAAAVVTCRGALHMKMDGIYYVPIVFSFKSLLGICLSSRAAAKQRKKAILHFSCV